MNYVSGPELRDLIKLKMRRNQMYGGVDYVYLKADVYSTEPDDWQRYHKAPEYAAEFIGVKAFLVNMGEPLDALQDLVRGVSGHVLTELVLEHESLRPQVWAIFRRKQGIIT